LEYFTPLMASGLSYYKWCRTIN